MPNFTRIIIWLKILFCTGLCASTGLAIAAPEVFILHNPIQPGTSQEITYTVIASDPQGIGIQSIEISIQRRLFQVDNQGQIISDLQEEILKPCPITAPFQTIKTCSITLPGYPDHSHIGYKATAKNMDNATNPDYGYIYFAAGKLLPAMINDPIPIYVHQSNTATKIDLVFIPDKDYGSSNWEQKFMTDVTELIDQAFFSEEPFARGVRSRHEMWNFHITYHQGDAVSCFSRKLPSNWTTLAATVNSGFIVHTDPFQDCSGIGEQSTFSAEAIRVNETDPRSYTVPVHELGHSVFSLADEYPSGYLFHSPLHSHNVFQGPGPDKCKSNARFFRWNPNDCKKIGQTGWYRSDKRKDIMKDTSKIDNPPGRSDIERYNWHYDQCTGQNC